MLSSSADNRDDSHQIQEDGFTYLHNHPLQRLAYLLKMVDNNNSISQDQISEELKKLYQELQFLSDKLE